jgi:hypothetical protein
MKSWQKQWSLRDSARRDLLPLVRVVLYGPRWTLLANDVALLEDVRERLCEVVREGVYAEWADPRERL